MKVSTVEKEIPVTKIEKVKHIQLELTKDEAAVLFCLFGNMTGNILKKQFKESIRPYPHLAEYSYLSDNFDYTDMIYRMHCGLKQELKKF